MWQTILTFLTHLNVEGNNLDVSYERACMATVDNEYFKDILDTLNKYQDRHGQRLSSKNIREAVRRVMDE